MWFILLPSEGHNGPQRGEAAPTHLEMPNLKPEPGPRAQPSSTATGTASLGADSKQHDHC